MIARPSVVLCVRYGRREVGFLTQLRGRPRFGFYCGLCAARGSAKVHQHGARDGVFVRYLFPTQDREAILRGHYKQAHGLEE